MALGDMVVFNDFMYRAFTEVMDQQVRLFNEASANTLVLQSARNIGDFSQEAYYELIPGLIRRRDAYGTGNVNAVDLSQLQKNTVKVAGGTVPVAWEPQQFSWIQRNQEEAGTVIGIQLAEGVFGDYLNAAVAALVGAITNNGDMTYDGTAGTLTLNALVLGSAKMGDRARALRAWIVHSKPMHDLWGAAVTNANTLFEFGTVNIVQDGFGRRFIITDSPSLIFDNSPNQYATVGLVEGGALVQDNGDLFSNVETSNGTENIQRTWQAEYTFNLGLKGYSWDIGNGGKSPTNAEIGTGTNWDQVATSNKDTAGVIVESD